VAFVAARKAPPACRPADLAPHWMRIERLDGIRARL
jgi:hypothetical protein